MTGNPSDEWIVVGGGFSGLVASAMLADRQQTVTLLEKSSRLGGVLNSPKSNGLYLDLGCHLFSNTDPETTRFLFKILEGEYHSVSVEYASVTSGKQIDGIGVPDFTSLAQEQKATILYEQAKHHARNQEADTDLDARLRHRYGATLAAMLAPVIEKIGLAQPAELDPSTLSRTPLNRIRIYDNETAKFLKEIPKFDEILAVPSQDDPMSFYPQAKEQYPHKNFYPSSQGMRGFVTAAKEYLDDSSSVEIVTSCEITELSSNQESVQVDFDARKLEAENLIWTAGPKTLAPLLDGIQWDFSHDVPMVLYYFFLPSDSDINYTYLHDFSPDSHVYRLSAPGFYGNQTNADGQSYLCAEVPTTVGSDVWEQPGAYVDTIWEKVEAYGITDRSNLEGVEIKQTPVSYPLYKAGAQAAFEEMNKQINAQLPSVYLLGLNAYSKTDIVYRLREVLNDTCAERSI